MAPCPGRAHSSATVCSRTAAVVLLAAFATACEIVDPGPAAGVASGCNVSPAFFVERIVPELIEKHDCAGAGNCHAAESGASVYQWLDTSDALEPSPADPLGTWPAPWQANFEATVLQLSCTSAELSPLWAKPAGGDTPTHGGGELFSADGAELELIEAWLSTGA